MQFHNLFVVATQTCDVVAPIETEPFIELIACIDDTAGELRNKPKNSTRWFSIPGTNYVILSIYRVTVYKSTVQNLSCDPWPGDSESLTDFRIWLSKRQGRRANPDIIEDSIVRPLNRIMSKAKKKETGKIFDSIVRELRLGPITSATPPFDTQIVILLKDIERLTDEEVKALDTVEQKISQGLSKEENVSSVRLVRTTAKRLSLYDYDSTIYLDFDSISSASGTEAKPLHSHLD